MTNLTIPLQFELSDFAVYVCLGSGLFGKKNLFLNEGCSKMLNNCCKSK